MKLIEMRDMVDVEDMERVNVTVMILILKDHPTRQVLTGRVQVITVSWVLQVLRCRVRYMTDSWITTVELMLGGGCRECIQ